MMPTRPTQRRKSIDDRNRRRTLTAVTMQCSYRFHIPTIFYPELQVGEWAAIPCVRGRSLLVRIQVGEILLDVLLLMRLIKGAE